MFQRLCSDVNEAAEVLTADASLGKLRDDAAVEEALFQVNASAQWSRAKSSGGAALAAFDRHFAKDKIVAVAILGLDTRFTWFDTNRLSGSQSSRTGTALYVLVWNRTRRRVDSLDVSGGLLVDDQGHQYSSEGAFYWTEDADRFNRHSTTLVPNAKLDGFLLYPGLRSGASAYIRWYLADNIKIGEKWVTAEYDVELPREPQERALLSSSLHRVSDSDESEDDQLDDLEDIDDKDDDLDDEWLYGDK